MLERLAPNPGAKPSKMRVGRGPGSGKGRYCGRGIKGQGTRSAGRPKGAGFEGGQMPIARRIPKRGFTNSFRKEVAIVNLSDLAGFGEGATVDVDALVARGLVARRHDAVKLLGDGDAPRGLTVKVHRASAQAKTKIEAAGGAVELV
ncbi:MAG: 50S ribosomal protein L15 [Myxococcota bacterium]|nr:50S ribosomal protein L15 [Myxococcales bacterium]